MSKKHVLAPSLTKNDRKAKTLIYLVSAIVFVAVVALKYLKLEVAVFGHPVS